MNDFLTVIIAGLLLLILSPGFFGATLAIAACLVVFRLLDSVNGSSNTPTSEPKAADREGEKDEFQQKLDNGEIRTYDDVIYHNGRYYENENSEEWEDFEYQYEEDHRR